MKKLVLFFVAAMMAPMLSWSQLAPGSFGQDFTVTDQFGEVHNLYNYLDEGYTVILDVSATWCGPCWSSTLAVRWMSCISTTVQREL